MLESLLKCLLCLPFLAVMTTTGYAQSGYQTTTFAGGCFWCMQGPFEALGGVKKVIVGYAGGEGESPTYQNYALKGYIEAVQVIYDPHQISYPELLKVFWRQIDPTDAGGQFCDRGPQYRSAIFYYSELQKDEAYTTKTALEQSGRYNKPIVTDILPATTFYPAEDYHQGYAKRNPIRYKFYRFNCGRDQYLKKIWRNALKRDSNSAKSSRYRKYSHVELKKRLTPLQYKVTQKNGTEPAYRNAYWDNYEPGIYVDIVSGEPLFSSQDKFKSSTGWPSFTKPLEPNDIVEKTDRRLFSKLTEVRSKQADSHLGHVFMDGPPPTGKRYCINSAALRFIPAKDMEKEGYGQYKRPFEK